MPNTGLKKDPKLKSQDNKPLPVAVAVIKNSQDQVLISLRGSALHQGGLWEFPGGKIEAGETPAQALARELKEELDITVTETTPLITVIHQYPDIAVQLHVFLVESYSGAEKSCHGQATQWVAAQDLPDFAFPAANLPIIKAAQLPAYYAILNDADEKHLMTNLEKILTSGIRLIQARLKKLPSPSVKTFIEQAYPLCKQHGAILLMNSAVKLTENNHCVNDIDTSIELLQQTGINGIHLTSPHLMERNRRPEHIKWLSASCHNQMELQHARQIEVDFVVLAPVLATQSHPGSPPLGWSQFSKLVANTNLPVYALGGMSQASLTEARKAGGQGIAGISAFYSPEEIHTVTTE